MALLNGRHEASQFRIRFDLDNLEKVPAWGKPGEYRLHWFGLTSGRFWIETQCGSPLEYTTATQEYWSSGKHPDYYVARLFEDLLSMLPTVLEPVPADMARRVADPKWRVKAEQWRDGAEDGQRSDQWYSATKWWHERSLYMGYLRYAPRLTLWRVEEAVFLQWKADGKINGIPVWVLSEGEISIGAAVFEAAVFGFCEELVGSMEHRVRSIQENGWKRTDCTLDVEELVSEQVTRREFFHKMQHEQQATDWRQARANLDVLLGLMGEPITNRV